MVCASLAPGHRGYNTMVAAWAAAENLSEARRWLRRMQGAALDPDEVTYGALIGGCARQGDLSRASQCLRDMEAAGIRPGAPTYNQLIDACWRSRPRARAPERVEEFLRRMAGEGVAANAGTLRSLSRAVGRKKAVELC